MNTKSIIRKINKRYETLINVALHLIVFKNELGKIILKSGKNTKCQRIDEWIRKWKPLGSFNKP